jgi:hypothetical protein
MSIENMRKMNTRLRKGSSMSSVSSEAKYLVVFESVISFVTSK